MLRLRLRRSLFRWGADASRSFSATSTLAINASPVGSASKVTAPLPALSLLSTPPTELRHGKGLWHALRRGFDPLEEMDAAVSPAHRAAAAACSPLGSLGRVLSQTASTSAGTQKLLLETADGLKVECVVIPQVGEEE